MAIYPAAGDRLNAMTKPGGLTERHALWHGRTMDLQENVKAYGAVGNGTGNDSASIQSAIAAAQALGNGGVVFFPPGNYAIGTTLTISGVSSRGVRLVGSGKGSTLIHNAGSNALIRLTGAGLDPSDVVIEDLRLAGGTGTGDGIWLDGSVSAIVSAVIIRNVVFENLLGSSSRAIFGTWAIGTYIDKCFVRGQRGIGFWFEQVSNAGVIRDCDMSNQAQGSLAIRLKGGITGWLIEGCVIEAWRGTGGIELDGVGSVHLVRNWFEDNDGADLTAGTISAGAGIYSANVTVESCNFESSRAGTTFHIDTPNAGATGGCLALALIGNRFAVKDVRLRSAVPGVVANYWAIGNWLVGTGTITDATSADDVVVMANRQTLLSAKQGIQGKYLSGAGKTTVVDGDFFGITPTNGTIAVHYDTSGAKGYISFRANGIWKVATPGGI